LTFLLKLILLIY